VKELLGEVNAVREVNGDALSNGLHGKRGVATYKWVL
jgi:hypothetical protein